MLKALPILLCILIAGFPAEAQDRGSRGGQQQAAAPTVVSAQRLMVRQKYSESTAQLKAILQREPYNIDALYALGAVEQTRILDYESYTIEGKRFQVYADSLRKIIESRMPALAGADSVRALFYCANLLGGVGIVQAKRGEWVDGARNAMTSANMYRQVKKFEPGHLGADLGMGAFDYYLGSAFKWIPFTTGASIERGVEAIERAQKAPFPFNHAARNTYCWILIDRKQFKKADSLAHAAILEMPGNSMFLRIRALIALWTGCYRDALLLAEKLTANAQNRNPVNWSDLISSRYITVNAHENLGQKAEAYAAACKALNMAIPAEYKTVPHVKEHLKYMNGIKGKYKSK